MKIQSLIKDLNLKVSLSNTDLRLYLVSFLLIAISLVTSAQQRNTCREYNMIGGKVWVDYNFNSVIDEDIAGLGGITVTAYDASGNIVATSTTGQSGDYILPIKNGRKVRVEFTNIPSTYTDGLNGTQSKTSVQFVSSPSCDVNLALTSTDCMCADNPPFIIPCYVNGGLSSAEVAERAALIWVGYDQRGLGANYETYPPTAGVGGMPNLIATAGQVGALWGVAYDARSKTGFSSALMKRFTDMGPGGLGAIYAVTDPTTGGSLYQYLDLAPCLGMSQIARPDIGVGVANPSLDEAGYNAAGKQGIGAIAVSSDGMYMYATDLTNKQLVRIKLRNNPNGPLLPGSCGNVTTYSIPTVAGCSTSDSRPWAVQTHLGDVYVGVVCGAESTKNAADMTVNVFKFNPQNASFTPVFDMPQRLDYTTKGCAAGGDAARCACNEWNPWLSPDEYLFTGPTDPGGFICHPQPLLSSIEFDVDGSMILGFMDRFALQVGFQNFHVPGRNQNFGGMTGGDLLYAYNDKINNKYVLSTGKDILDANGSVIRSGCGNDPTFTGVEFYCADNVAGNHVEGFHGGLGFLKGRQELVGTFVDAGIALGSGQVNGGGVHYVNNQTGAAEDYYTVFYNAGNLTFGKANGLGDLGFACELPSIEIGNFVWIDGNKNGIQDPGEEPIVGTTVTLYSSSGSVVGTTQTNTNGEYYFNDSNTSGLSENTMYFVVLSDYVSGVGLTLSGKIHILSPNDVGSNDLRDSDGRADGSSGIGAIGNLPFIKVTTGGLGWNDHTLDFGLFPNSCLLEISDIEITECNIKDKPITNDIVVRFNWINALIGDILNINVNGTIKPFTVTTVDGNGFVILQVPSGIANIPVSIVNSNNNLCSDNTTISTVNNLLTITTVTPGACYFDPIEVQSYFDLQVTVDFTGLNIGDQVNVKIGTLIKSFTVVTVTGSSTVTFKLPADGTLNHQIIAELNDDKCAIVYSSYNAPNECPKCVVKVTKAIVGECIYNTTTLASSTKLTVEVYWNLPNIPGVINVTANGMTNSINVNTISGTFTTTFIVNANGAVNQPIGVGAQGDPSCNTYGSSYNAAEPCTQKRDLLLEKFANSSTAAIGQLITWTVQVTHQGDQTATGIQVTDVLPSGLTYAGVYAASKGTFVGGIWNIGSMNFGEVETLKITSTVTKAGVFFNDAEISRMNENDVDSTPGNNVPTEDDQDVACISVPFKICEGSPIDVTAQLGLYNYKWYKNGVLIPGANTSSYTITQIGEYTYTATTNPVGGQDIFVCCPIVAQAGTCTCEIDITDVDQVPCVNDLTATTTKVTICAAWTDAGANSTISFSASGSTAQLTNQLSNSSGCVDLIVPIGANITASVSTSSCSDMMAISTPPYCPQCNITVSGANNIGPCVYNSSDKVGVFSYSVNVNWENVEIGRIIEFTGSGAFLQHTVTTKSGTHTFNISGGIADGQSQPFVANLMNVASCKAIGAVLAPAACAPSNCSLEITSVIPSICEDNKVDFIVNVEWKEATIGDVVTVNAGGQTQVSSAITAGNSTNGGAAFLFNFNAPTSGNVAASFSGNSSCSDNEPYNQPAACPSCALTLKSFDLKRCYYDPVAKVGKFDVQICVDWANAFGGDIVNFRVGDSIVLASQQSSHYILSNTTGTICKTLTLLGNKLQDLDVLVYFNVTNCQIKLVDYFDAPNCIHDLALDKVLDTNAPYAYGNKLSYTIKVYNQGEIYTDQVRIVDYVPNGFKFNIADNPGWTVGVPTAQFTPVYYTLNKQFNPGDSHTVPLILELLQTAGNPGTDWFNYSEIISSREELSGLDISLIDDDSTVGTDSPMERGVKPGDANDNNILGGGPKVNQDEDDHDPAGPWIFDLAVKIVNSTDIITSYGQVLTFPITLVNQGNIASQGYTVSVKVPSGFNFGANSAAWTYNALTGVARYTSTAVINPGITNNFNLVLVAKPAFGPSAWTVVAEISEDHPIADEVGIKDIDSTPDSDFTNDAGGAPIPDSEGGLFPGSDDILTGIGTGTPGDTVASTDEDDSDPEYVQIFDLALTKVPESAGPFTLYDDIKYTISIINQGSVSADNILITDYLPTCFDLVDVTWTNNGNGTASKLLSVANGLLLEPLKPGLTATTNLTLRVSGLCQNGFHVNYSEISSATDAIGVVRPDADSTPDTNPSNDAGGAPETASDDSIDGNGTGTPLGENALTDEDDHDPAQVEVIAFADLALLKTLSPSQRNPVNPGDQVTFLVQVLNQGFLETDNITITDYIPSCFALNDPNWVLNNNGTASHTFSVANGRLNSYFDTGNSYIIPITFTVQPCANGIITNWSEITSFTSKNGGIIPDIDSKPDNDNTNDTYLSNNDITGDGKNGGDEDDQDPEQVIVVPNNEGFYDLALMKRLAPGQPSIVATGDIVVFRIEVVNQGTFYADKIEITDYLPGCFTLADNDWTISGLNKASILLSVANGGLTVPLAPGQSKFVDINLQVANCINNGNYNNWAEISGGTDEYGNVWPDVDSTPDTDQNNDTFITDNDITGNGKTSGDEDDHDVASVTVSNNTPRNFDLALMKRLANGQPNPIKDGSLLTFTITVVNQGDVSANFIEITDYLEPCMVLADADWISSGTNKASIMLSTLNGALANPLLPNSSISVDLTVRVQGCLKGTHTNWAEISNAKDSNGNPVTDVDSKPDNTNDDTFIKNDDLTGNGLNGGDEDDHDPANFTITEDPIDEEFDLALLKILGPGQKQTVAFGDLVTFNILVINQGDIPADNIEITDYFPSCLELTDANWTNNGNNTAKHISSIANGKLNSALGVGQNILVPITFRVLQCSGTSQINWAEISGATDQEGVVRADVDSTPDNIQGNDSYLNNNDVNGNGRTGGDEDDHDPEEILILNNLPKYDLALIKTLSLGQSSNVNIGSNVSFDIQITNQGEAPATNIEITDYIPNCVSLNDANWINNGNGTAKRVISGPLAPNQSTIVSIVLQVQSCATGTLNNFAEISSFKDADGNTVLDVDSTPDNDNTNDRYLSNNSISGDGKNGGDEDDHDPEPFTIDSPNPCSNPVLTVGTTTCLGNFWSTTFYNSLGSLVTVNGGAISGNSVVNIPLGQNIIITATEGVCVTNLTAIAPSSCPSNCTYPKLTLGQPICSTTGFYKVSFTWDGIGNIVNSAGTVSGNQVINIPIGVTLSLSAINGACVSEMTVASPVSCVNPCENPIISVSGPLCSVSGTTYSVNYSLTSGATVVPSAGTISGNSIINIPAGTNLILTGSLPGCSNDVIIVQAPSCSGNCMKPVITSLNPTCSGGFWSVTFYNSVGSTVSASAGTVSGNQVINIPLGTNLVLTATLSPGCSSSLSITGPSTCPTNCTYPVMSLGQPVCTGLGTYKVSYTWDGIGNLTRNAGTISGNTIIDIPINTNLVLTSTNGVCVTNLTATSPLNCVDPCENPAISLSGPICSASGTTYSVNYTLISGATVSASAGVISGSSVINIPAGVTVTFTVVQSGCPNEVISVPAPNCNVCEKPVLTSLNPTCSGGFWSVTFYNSVGSTVSASAGTVSGNQVVNIPLGTNLVLTATISVGCSSSLSITGPSTCPSNCTFSVTSLGQPVCTGLGTYKVSYTWDGVGNLTRNAGTISGNSIVDIPIGTNLVLTATNGACVTNLTATSPANCINPCENPAISLSGPICSASGTTYSINYTLISGGTISTSAGVVIGNSVINIPAGVNVTLIVTQSGCPIDVVIVPAPNCGGCEKPVLTAGNPLCSGNFWSVTFYNSVGSTVSASAGTVSGNQVVNIPLGTNLVLTATLSPGCSSSLSITGPSTCPTNCTYPVMSLGQPVCTGLGTYKVSFTWDGIGNLTRNTGTISGNSIIDIPIGTNLVLTATNGACVTNLTATSPSNCVDPCENPAISISGPICSASGTTYSVNYTLTSGATVSASAGVISGNSVINIPTGVNVTLTAVQSGCPNEVVTVPAPNCGGCEKPVLTAGSTICSGSFWSVTFYNSVGSTVSASAGTVSGNKVVNIPLGTNLVLTATLSPGCTSTLTVTGPISCPSNCTFPVMSLGQPVCTGLGTYKVSFTWDGIGNLTRNAGTISGNSVIDIPIGTNLVLTATNGACPTSLTATSPVNCVNPCENPAISLSGPICSASGTTYSVNYALISGASVNTSAGVFSGNSVINIPTGVNVTLTAVQSGCPNEVVTIAAPNCGNQEFDLALIKVLAIGQSPTVQIGDLVTFDIFVINQGDIVADNITITDYIPSCFTLADSDWVNNGNGTASITLSASHGDMNLPLRPEMSKSIPITLRVNNCTDGSFVNNFAEISNATDVNGNPQSDVDSNFDNINGNDGTVKDNDVNGNGLLGGDEDDHDIATVMIMEVQEDVFDLALVKKLRSGQTSPVPFNSILSFDINVYNQGNIPADNIKITDYLPSCATLLDAAWTNNGNGTASILLSVANGRLPFALLSGQSVTIPITINLRGCTYGTYSNWAEISGATDDIGNPVTDVDSTPDDNKNNDTYQTNNDILGNGIEGGDEDDHDPEFFEIYPLVMPIFDLALIKTFAPGQESNVVDGSVVVFNISVFNQGKVPADNIRLVDQLPSCFTLIDPNWYFDPSNNQAVRILSVASGGLNSPLAPGSSITVPITVRLNGCTLGPKINYAEIQDATDSNGNSVTDVDSNPDNDMFNDVYTNNDYIGGNGKSGKDEDDHDPAVLTVISNFVPTYDIALIKILAPGQVTNVEEGNLVNFQIQVTNQGTEAIDNIRVIDYLPSCMTLVDNDWIDNGNGTASITLSVANGFLLSPITSGQSVLVPITMVVGACEAGTKVNYAEVSRFTDGIGNTVQDVDSTPDTNPDNDTFVTNNDISGNGTNGGDEDDSDPEYFEIIPKFDLALIKTVSPPLKYTYGDNIPFTITITNQGNVVADNITITDYLPIGYTFVAASNPGWTSTGSGKLTYVITDLLLLNQSVNIPLNLILKRTNGSLTDWINRAEISSATDKNGVGQVDVDSYMDNFVDNDNQVFPNDANDNKTDGSAIDGTDEDDSDPAGVKVLDLALNKTINQNGPFKYGDIVVFNINLYNQGNTAAKNIEIADYIPCGFKWTQINNPSWSYNASSSIATMIYATTIQPGGSATVQISLQLQDCYGSELTAWTNAAEIKSATDTIGNPFTDIDSKLDDNPINDGTPIDDEINSPNDEDDHDISKANVFDLALTKHIENKGPYAPGEIANYIIKVFNQGNMPAYNVQVTDYLNYGYTFATSNNAGWNLSGNLIQYTIPGPIMPGTSTTLQLNLQVIVRDNAQLHDWYNETEISRATDVVGNVQVDADSTPDTNPNNDNELVDGPDDDFIFDEDDNNDNVINENINDPFNEGDDDEDDNDAAEIIVVGGLGDTVWKDLDGDGIQDAGEPGVQGVVATLTDCNGKVLSTQVTNSSGFYFFNNLIPGNYQVQFDISSLPLGCAFTFQNVGNNDAIDSDVDLSGLGPCTYINGGEYDSTYDAGLLILAKIGDFVWHDLDGNGQQNFGEPGIPGVKVSLYKSDGTFVRSMLTDANGKYLFDQLYPGNYYLKFVDPTGYERTFANVGNDATDSDVDNSNGLGTTFTTYLGPGEVDLTWDAGFYKCIPIGDLVWYDINKNDIWDSNENGINGLRVNLWRNHFGTWTVWEHKYTGVKPNSPSDDGYFIFCAPPGQYYIQVIMPPLGLVLARANIGTNEEIDSDLSSNFGPGTSASFIVTSGQEKLDLGAGYYPMAVAGNLVWMDENMNGVQEVGEARMSGVMVEAYDANTHQKLAESTTDAEGAYMLDYLEKRDIYIKFTPPAGYSATVAGATDDAMDSDVDHSYGHNTTRMFSMESAMVNENIDMGLAFGVLPVDWLDVNARRVNDKHIISWSTAREVNVSHYEVERQLEGEKEFTLIPGRVEAKGNSAKTNSYNLQDLDVANVGAYLYKVKQVDLDGKFTYSRIVKVYNSGDVAIDLYPNPAKSETNVEVNLSDDSTVKIELFDSASKLVRTIKKSDVQLSGVVNYNIDLEDIQAGVYNVIITINGNTIQKKLIRIE